ncbi:MAG: PrsW family intramembrane metalloprotease [Lactobacillus sp.]|nr:PrsW family intramembrane metalloprotease [Lactobacillus sp.]
MNDKYVFCPNCGTKNSITSKFCINCGNKLPTLDQNSSNSRVSSKEGSSILDTTTSKINSWTGGNGAVKVSLKDFFSQVFKHHTQEEAEEIFIVGTKRTTPSLNELINDKVQPWLFSRALLFTSILAILLWILSLLNPRVGITVSLDASLAVAVPVSALILFFEVNIYRNISFYTVIKIALAGGTLSLIVAMILDTFFGNNGTFNLSGAVITGISEEVSKVLVAGYFIYKLKAKHIFNGLLIGAAVGSGFAAFENIMYMINDETGQLATITEALIRSVFSISDHTEWCAITAAALVLTKGSKQLGLDDFLKPTFLKFLISVILIHTLWDWNIYDGIFKYVILAIITWLFVFVLIHAGLREVQELKLRSNKKG